MNELMNDLFINTFYSFELNCKYRSVTQTIHNEDPNGGVFYVYKIRKTISIRW